MPIRVLGKRYQLTASSSADADAHRVELVLGRARTFLSACSLIAIYIDPTSPAQFSALAFGLVLAYLVGSVINVVLLEVGRVRVSNQLQVITHGIDLIWALAITLISTGPSSPFFVYFIFVLLAAAYRWGLRGTVITTVIGIAALAAEALTLYARDTVGEFETNRLIVRVGYLAMVGALAGYLSEHDKVQRAQTLTAANLLERAQSQRTLRATMNAVLRELAQAFSARQVLLAVEENATGNAYLWVLSASSANVDRLEIPVTAKAEYFSIADKPGFLRAYDFASVVAVPVNFMDQWVGRLFLLDPGFDPADKRVLDFLTATFAEVAPAIHNVYLYRRLRSRIGAMERSRLAHELHDGVIQSLVAAEMQLDVLRRQSSGDSLRQQDLGRIQDIVRVEVEKLRKLMNQLRPADMDPRELPGFLAELVERFRSETGIATRFFCDELDFPLRTTVAREIAQITQEALVNVRKHAAAKNVLVQFGSEAGTWKLIIHDDGQGFGFSGILSGSDIEKGWQAPLIIRERVRRAGGRLSIESGPNFGSRLEITIPKNAHV